MARGVGFDGRVVERDCLRMLAQHTVTASHTFAASSAGPDILLAQAFAELLHAPHAAQKLRQVPLLLTPAPADGRPVRSRDRL